MYVCRSRESDVASYDEDSCKEDVYIHFLLAINLTYNLNSEVWHVNYIAVIFLKIRKRASEIVQWVKTLATKPDDLRKLDS